MNFSLSNDVKFRMFKVNLCVRDGVDRGRKPKINEISEWDFRTRITQQPIMILSPGLLFSKARYYLFNIMCLNIRILKF